MHFHRRKSKLISQLGTFAFLGGKISSSITTSLHQCTVSAVNSWLRKGAQLADVDETGLTISGNRTHLSGWKKRFVRGQTRNELFERLYHRLYGIRPLKITSLQDASKLSQPKFITTRK